MDRKEYLQALENLDMTQSQAGEFFVKNPVTGRRWALASYDGPPRPVAMFLRLMIKLNLTPDKVVNLIGDKDPIRPRIDDDNARASYPRRQAALPWQAYIWPILQSLRDKGDMVGTVTAAKDLGCSAAQARTAVNALHADGLVSQSKSEENRNLVWKITPKGIETLNAKELSTAHRAKNSQHTATSEN